MFIINILGLRTIYSTISYVRRGKQTQNNLGLLGYKEGGRSAREDEGRTNGQAHGRC